jgi:hypothetical protein
MVSVAGTVAGSPVARHTPELMLDLAAQFPGTPCVERDPQGLAELSPAARLTWLRDHHLPQDVAYFSLVTFAAPERVSRLLEPTYRRLAWVDPRNDGMMLAQDQIIPGSELVGFVNADHLAVAVPITREVPATGLLLDHNEFPREALYEAVLRYVAERLTERRA